MKKLFLLLTITGLLLSSHGCEVKPFKDFDVASNTFDANVFPLNPKWGKQVQHNAIPNPGESCPIQSDSDNPDDWTKSPQYPYCTSYPVTFNGGKFCGPHVNFMPVTYEGIVTWDDHSASLFPFGDDDYTLNVHRDDEALYTTTGSQVHIEFDSDETVDNWDDTGTWWDSFHHNGVDDSKAHAAAMIDGSSVIVIGLLNLDTLHGNGGDGKTELHPVYAMFVHLKGNPLIQSSWAFFVRNWGDQGYCGDDQQNLYTREQKIKVKIPNVAGLSSYNIWKGAQEEDNSSSMNVTAQPSGDGILLTFDLLPPEKQSWFVGDLTFTPRPPVNTTSASTATPAAGGNQNTISDNDKSADSDLEARINKLPESSKKELYAQLRNLVPRKKPVRVQLAVIAEPAKFDETYYKSPVRVPVDRALVRPSNDSASKLKRQKRIEFVRQYLAERGVK
ncbi:MAG TPA: hypothetical protein DC054_06590 [Blastocatellia bacterium]|nr:hypothetical protein [Blastocatellia bacterium]